MDYETQTQESESISGGLAGDIRGVVADIERRLDRLRRAHGEREREREDLEERSRQLRERSQEIEERANALAGQEADLSQRRAELEAQAEAIGRRQADMDAREAQLAQAVSQAQQRHAEARRALDGERSATTRARAEADNALSEAARREEEAARVAEQARVKLADLEEDRRAIEQTARELDERQRDLDAQAAELADRAGELDAQRRELEARAGELAEQDRRLGELSRALAEREERLGGDSSDLEQQKRWLAEQTAQADMLRARVASLESDLERARSAGQDGADAQQALRDAEEHARHRIEQAVEQAQRQADERAEALEAKLRHAAQTIADLRDRLEEATDGTGSAAAPVDAEHLGRRRRRLRYVREQLRDEGAKLAKASELLRQRTAALQASSPATDKPQAQRRADAGRSHRGLGLMRVGVGMAAAAFAVALLASLSWVAADHVVTPTYRASVGVAHDPRGRAVAEQDLVGWQSALEGLLGDPRFAEFAAEHMRRRGLLGLGDAVAMRRFLEERVAWTSPRPGELRLDVREVGADRAERVADTLAIALIQQANSSRDRRPDGLPSIIDREAAAAGDPLVDQRPMYAGGILGGGLLLCLAVGAVASRRLGRLREQVSLEGHTDLDDMGDQSDKRIAIG